MLVSLEGFSQACCTSLQGQHFAHTGYYQIFFLLDIIFGKCWKTLPSQNKRILIYCVSPDRPRLLFVRRVWPKRMTKVPCNYDGSRTSLSFCNAKLFPQPLFQLRQRRGRAASGAQHPRGGRHLSAGCAGARAPFPARRLSLRARRQNSRPPGRLRAPDPVSAGFWLRDAPVFSLLCSLFLFFPPNSAEEAASPGGAVGPGDCRSPGTPAGLHPLPAALRGAPRVPRMPRAPSADGGREGGSGEERKGGRRKGGRESGRLGLPPGDGGGPPGPPGGQAGAAGSGTRRGAVRLGSARRGGRGPAAGGPAPPRGAPRPAAPQPPPPPGPGPPPASTPRGTAPWQLAAPHWKGSGGRERRRGSESREGGSPDLWVTDSSRGASRRNWTFCKN